MEDMDQIHSHGQLTGLVLVLVGAALAGASAASSAAVKWDYIAHPVTVVENRPGFNPGIGIAAPAAFDGYGAQGSRPAAVRCWLQTLPTQDAPSSCAIDYGRPVAPSAFVNYCYVPDNRDMRFVSPAPSAFRRVRVSSRSSEQSDWATVAMLEDLPAACPQVLPLGVVSPARCWQIEVLEMVPGAHMICTYELETYTGGVPALRGDDAARPDFRAAFTERIARSRLGSGAKVGTPRLRPLDGALAFTLEDAGKPSDCGLELVIGGQPVPVARSGSGKWQAKCLGGEITVSSRPTAAGALLELVFAAEPTNPVRHVCGTLRLSVSDPSLYFVPAYVWSRTPVDARVSNAQAQTRFVCLSTNDSSVCLFPGTDRGSMGFAGGSAFVDLLLGPRPTPVLLTTVRGDWWSAYQFAVTDVYGFQEQAQTAPVSEIQYGISKYMLRDDVWEPTLGTVRSWPEHDPHMKLVGFDCFQFYGVPYSIPTYWARWRMSGDRMALDRCRSIVRWMCRSGVRVREGPARGAFYTLQRFPPGQPPTKDARGSTQGWGLTTLTSQSTGSALWSLLYYRKVTGDRDQEVDEVIGQAAEWLVKTQTPDGGWPYGHDLAGKPVDGAPSSGSIWNIWALWRLGRETGNSRYSEAARRSIVWYGKTFVAPHHYHGYWEDVGPGCREGYEAGIAAVAFGEMGERDLAVQAARDAVQWVFTRQIENREPTNSAGLVAEQTGWPPASYCNPMMGLAAHTVWTATGDDFWRPFAMIPKAIGWWYQPESGAMVWIVDSIQLAPLAGPAFESWWNDWCIAQVGALSLRWLCREVVRFSRGKIDLDEELLMGSALGQPVTAWAPPSGLRPIIPAHGQVNWLGLRGEESFMVVLLNYGEAGTISCHLDSRDTGCAFVRPLRAHTVVNGIVRSAAWERETPVNLPAGGLVALEWRVRP